MSLTGKQWFISYLIDEKPHISGPYTSEEAARYNAVDLVIFGVGIYNVRVFDENPDDLLDAKLASAP